MIPSRAEWGVVPVRAGTPVVHQAVFSRYVIVSGPLVRIEPYTGTAPPDRRTAEGRFTNRYGPVLAQALAQERPDPGCRPYRAEETDLVPPDPAEPFEPGCDRCGGLPTRYTIGADGAWYRLCTGHMSAAWIRRYTPTYLTREQERYVAESFLRWGR